MEEISPLSLQADIKPPGSSPDPVLVYKLHAAEDRAVERQPSLNVLCTDFFRVHDHRDGLRFSFRERDQDNFFETCSGLLLLGETGNTLFISVDGSKNYLKVLSGALN